MSPAFYNEIEAYPAAWMRNLIASGHIAPGVVDERSIRDLTPADLRGATQCHFFAGIAVWSHALRSAGWPDDRPVWTGSCPCQPFSSAGRRGGFDDDRHLWPVWFELIRECRPDVVLGEQVSGPDGLRWFDAVSSDLESAGYAVGALDTCAAGCGAPHIRQRLYFVAVSNNRGRGANREPRDGREVVGRADSVLPAAPSHAGAHGRAAPVRVADADITGPQGRGERGHGGTERAPRAGRVDRGMEHADDKRWHEGKRRGGNETGWPEPDHASIDRWSDAEWIACSDGKSRPTGAGIRPLVDGPARRVGPDGAVEEEAITGQLKGYGNGLVSAQAEAFIRAVMAVLS